MQRKDIPIWRDANRLLLEVELAVRHFPRYHKYTLGTEMRHQAMKICKLVSRAWRGETPPIPSFTQGGDDGRLLEVQRLVLAVDDLKIQLQLGRELQVFRNFAEFEKLAGLAVQVGKQSGGWLRHMQAAQPGVSRHA